MEQEQMNELPLQARVDIWRQKAIAGTLTDDELKEAVLAIREDRVTAAALGVSKRATKAPPRSAEELLKGFLDSGAMGEPDANNQ